VLLLLLAVATAGVLAVRAGTLEVPPHWNPWTPPDPAQPPGTLVRFQLMQLADDHPACMAWLEKAGVRATPVPDRATGAGCGLEGAVRLSGAPLARHGAVTASCPMAAAWTLYERWVLDPAAREHLGAPVASVQHFGTYACRNVRRTAGQSGARSQHATANALDLAGVTLADGRRLSVKRDWQGEGPEARFWRAAAEGACRLFNVTLTPDYNALHADHLHLDMGPWRACR